MELNLKWQNLQLVWGETFKILPIWLLCCFFIDVFSIQLWALAVLYLYLQFAIIFTPTPLTLCKIVGTLSRGEFNTWNAWHFLCLALWMPVSDRLIFSVTSDYMGDLWALDNLWPFGNILSPFWLFSNLWFCKTICPLAVPNDPGWHQNFGDDFWLLNDP